MEEDVVVKMSKKQIGIYGSSKGKGMGWEWVVNWVGRKGTDVVNCR